LPPFGQAKAKRSELGATESGDECFSEYQQLKCSICMSIFQEPCRCPCGHTFCRGCIEPWVKKNKSCPEDRQPVFLAELHDDLVVRDVIDSTTVPCLHREEGCRWKGILHGLKQHLARCKHNPCNKPEWLRDHEPTLPAPEIEDIDVEYLEKGRDEASPPPMSLAMRMLSKGTKDDKKMLKGLLTHKEEDFNQEILQRAASHDTASPAAAEDSEDSDCVVLGETGGESSESGEEEERAAEKQRARALTDIGNQLNALKQKKEKGGKPGWKQSRITGRWVKA